MPVDGATTTFESVYVEESAGLRANPRMSCRTQIFSASREWLLWFMKLTEQSRSRSMKQKWDAAASCSNAMRYYKVADTSGRRNRARVSHLLRDTMFIRAFMAQNNFSRSATNQLNEYPVSHHPRSPMVTSHNEPRSSTN